MVRPDGLNPADDFRDDGGTPSYRAARHAARWAPFWLVVRFVWLFPLVAIGMALIFAGAWVVFAVIAGENSARSHWALLLLFAVVSGWQSLVGKKGSFGRGPLWFSGMMTSPSLGARGFQGAAGATATMFRSFFVCIYGCYVIFFWLIVGCVLWIEHAALIRLVLSN